jgi:hypothetical protein
LVDADLMFAEASARSCVEKKECWTKAVRLTTDGWEQHRSAIAAKLPFDNWVAVVVAVTAIDHLQESRDPQVDAGFFREKSSRKTASEASLRVRIPRLAESQSQAEDSPEVVGVLTELRGFEEGSTLLQAVRIQAAQAMLRRSGLNLILLTRGAAAPIVRRSRRRWWRRSERKENA